MRSVFSLLGLVLLTPCVFAQPVLIDDVTIVSPEVAYEGPQDVLIRDGRIEQIAPHLAAPAGAIVLDGRDHFLTPGLIDSHVHVGSNGGLRRDLIGDRIDLLRAFRIQEPRSYLYWGFTTLLDIKASDAKADAWNTQAEAPELLNCIGAPFADGYGMAFEAEESRFDTPFYIADERRPERIGAGDHLADHTPEAVAARIRAETQVSCVKTFYETGFGGLFDFNTPSQAQYDRIAAAFEQAGLTHFSHANSLEAWRASVQANVDVLAHGL